MIKVTNEVKILEIAGDELKGFHQAHLLIKSHRIYDRLVEISYIHIDGEPDGEACRLVVDRKDLEAALANATNTAKW